MEIRKATRADLDELAAIESAANSLYVEHFGATEWYEPLSGSDRAGAPGFVLVAGPAEEGVPPYGFVQVLEWHGDSHLDQISVRPQWQRQGIGTALIQAAARETARNGHREMTLMTYLDVPWNAPYYRRLGFRSIEPRSPLEVAAGKLEYGIGLPRYGTRTLMVAGVTSEGVTRE
jgi:GNAT superfamily N-acetyltransferase